jgi:O-methyltransferase
VYGEAFRRCFEFFVGTGITGDILEFGTYRGYSARLIAGLMKKFNWQGKLYLFDSFEGFPEFSTPIESESYEVAVTKSWYPGQAKPEAEVDMAIRLVLEQIIPTESLELVKGFYSDTLPTWRDDSSAALVNIDCDLYESTLLVLNHLIEKEIFQDGTVLLFDDFNSNRANPKLGERRALAESFDSQDRYSYSPFFTYGWHGAAFYVHDLSLEFG